MCREGGSRRRAGISPGASSGGLSHGWVSTPRCVWGSGMGGIGHGWVSQCKEQPRRRAPGRGVVAAGGAGRGGGVM